MLNTLSFKTQNQEPIDTSKCLPVGSISAKFCELLQGFGLPRLGGERDDQIQWDVRFADGMVLTVYQFSDEPELVDSWFVGGTSLKVMERFTTLMSLMREESEACIHDLSDSIESMMRGVEDRHGKKYAITVNIGRLSHKLHSLMCSLISAVDQPDEVREALQNATTDITGRIVAHAATLSGVINSHKDIEGLIETCAEIEEAEQKMAQAVFRSINKGRGYRKSH